MQSETQLIYEAGKEEMLLFDKIRPAHFYVTLQIIFLREPKVYKDHILSINCWLDVLNIPDIA